MRRRAGALLGIELSNLACSPHHILHSKTNKHQYIDITRSNRPNQMNVKPPLLFID